jgi:hypothetical protein
MPKVQKSRISRGKRAIERCRLEKGLFGQEILNDTEGDESFIKAMKFFEGTIKTEASFFIRFELLPLDYLKILRKKFNTQKDWEVFREIKKFWKIKS